MDAEQQGSFFPERPVMQPTTLPVPIVWSAHSPEDQELLLEELDSWVEWLADRFRLDHRVVPDCWHDHPEVLEELSALHLAWQGAYATMANADAPLRWLEQFAGARLRIADWVARTGCRPHEHRPRREPGRGRPPAGKSPRRAWGGRRAVLGVLGAARRCGRASGSGHQ